MHPRFHVPLCWRLFLVLMLVLLVGPRVHAASGEVRWWLTTEKLEQKMAVQPVLRWAAGEAGADRIRILPGTKFQTLFGLGSSLEPSTCSNLWRMTPEHREEVVRKMVDPVEGIGMNLMRLCIGTPDFTGDSWYSYNDLPAGERDPEMKKFSIDRDRAYILPVVKLAKRLNPSLLFFASPWSPPGWMKSTGTMIGGHLLPENYPAYARYFVRYLQAMEAEGIPIHAVTVQNEPGVDRAREKDPKWFYPSCRWTGEQERNFIRDHLGPALRAAGLKTLIWCYDHNYNLEPNAENPGVGYPRTVLSDPAAARFVGGVAFHGYEGKPAAMTRFHGEFPRVPIHFTEGSVFGIGGAEELIERLRNWATSYNSWVMILDDKGKPNNGPFPATHAAIALNTRTLQAEYLLEYYSYGHFMRFLPRGSVRVESLREGGAPANVAFVTPDGTRVVVVANTGAGPATFDLQSDGQVCRVTLPARSVSTFSW